MENALYTLLTDAEARDATSIDAQRDGELSTYAFWFD